MGVLAELHKEVSEIQKFGNSELSDRMVVHLMAFTAMRI